MIKILKLKDKKNEAYSNLRKLSIEKNERISSVLLTIYIKASVAFSLCFFSHFFLLNYFDGFAAFINYGIGMFTYLFFILGCFILTFIYLFQAFFKMMNKHKSGELSSFLAFSILGTLSILFYCFCIYQISLDTLVLSHLFSIPFLFTMIVSFFGIMLGFLERSESKYPNIKNKRSFEDINRDLDISHDKIEKIFQDELKIIKDKDAIYEAVEYIKLEKSSEQDISYIEYILNVMEKNKTNDEKKKEKYNKLLNLVNENFESENKSDLEIENV